MPRLEGFVGPSYTSLSPIADTERCVNLVPEAVESGKGPSPAVLYNTPGLSAFASLTTGGPVTALATMGGRTFAVAGSQFSEVSSVGVVTARGAVLASSRRATISTNGQSGDQVFVTVGGLAYCYDLTDNSLVAVAPGAGGDTLGGAFVDGYFLAFSSAGFSFSALEDGTDWDALDVAQRSSAGDPIVWGAVAHREVWLFGQETTEAWYNTGDSDNPFQPVPGSLMDQGAIGPTVTAADNTLLWVGQNRQGGGIAYRAQGYLPVRISTHAVEAAWQRYDTMADARAWTYELFGHVYYVVTFPTAEATWVYDVATGLWHEWSYRNPTTNASEAHRGWCHTFTGTRHLVGDRATGAIYTLDPEVYADAGDPIVRLRQAPHLTAEHRRVFYHRFELFLETGLGLSSGQGAAPTVMLSWSQDGGRTFGSEHQMGIGAQGEYLTRAYLQRLGRSRDRVFRVTMSDPIPARWVDCFVDATVGD